MKVNQLSHTLEGPILRLFFVIWPRIWSQNLRVDTIFSWISSGLLISAAVGHETNLSNLFLAFRKILPRVIHTRYRVWLRTTTEKRLRNQNGDIWHVVCWEEIWSWTELHCLLIFMLSISRVDYIPAESKYEGYLRKQQQLQCDGFFFPVRSTCVTLFKCGQTVQ